MILSLKSTVSIFVGLSSMLADFGAPKSRSSKRRRVTVYCMQALYYFTVRFLFQYKNRILIEPPSHTNTCVGENVGLHQHPTYKREAYNIISFSTFRYFPIFVSGPTLVLVSIGLTKMLIPTSVILLAHRRRYIRLWGTTSYNQIPNIYYVVNREQTKCQNACRTAIYRAQAASSIFSHKRQATNANNLANPAGTVSRSYSKA